MAPHPRKLFPTFQQALFAIFQTRVVCLDHVFHRRRFAGAGDTGQCLEPVSCCEPVNEFFYRPGLIASNMWSLAITKIK